MIKLGKLTDYAIVVMGQLAAAGGLSAPCSARSLAEKTGVPEPTVAKVLKLLARQGLVASSRGAAGGYRLARAPDRISLADIVTALDGPIMVVSCVEGSAEDCRTKAVCPMKGRWSRVNRALRAAFEGIRLAEMIGPGGDEAPFPLIVGIR